MEICSEGRTRSCSRIVVATVSVCSAPVVPLETASVVKRSGGPGPIRVDWLAMFCHLPVLFAVSLGLVLSDLTSRRVVKTFVVVAGA